MRKLLVVVVFGLFFTPAAHADSKPQCVEGRDHIIAVASNVDDLGVDMLGDSIAVFPKSEAAPIDCVFDKTVATQVFEGPYIFNAAIGDFLVLGEASNIEHLKIYDLNTGELLLEAPVYSMLLSSTEVVYWEIRGTANAENCQDFALYQSYGGVPVMTYERRYSFDTRLSAETGNSICKYQQ